MTTLRHVSELAALVMPAAVADFAADYPEAPALTHEVSTRAVSEHGAPPRVVWVPSADDFQGPQKRARGGQDAQHSLGTRVCSVTLVCWVADVGDTPSIDVTDDLVEILVRHLLLKSSPSGVGVDIQRGQWVSEPGHAALGEAYSLSITFPVDIRASRTAGTRATVAPQLDTTTANPSPSDSTLDSGDLP